MATKEQIIAIKSTIARLAMSVSRKMRVTDDLDFKLNLLMAGNLLNQASNVAEYDDSLARTLYSQARQLAVIKGKGDDRQE